MQYSKLGSINYPKYSKNNNLSTQYILVILHPKAMAQAKPSQSQSLALAFGLAWRFSKPRPPQAKPKPLAFRPSQARTSLTIPHSDSLISQDFSEYHASGSSSSL